MQPFEHHQVSFVERWNFGNHLFSLHLLQLLLPPLLSQYDFFHLAELLEHDVHWLSFSLIPQHDTAHDVQSQKVRGLSNEHNFIGAEPNPWIDWHVYCIHHWLQIQWPVLPAPLRNLMKMLFINWMYHSVGLAPWLRIPTNCVCMPCFSVSIFIRFPSNKGKEAIAPALQTCNRKKNCKEEGQSHLSAILDLLATPTGFQWSAALYPLAQPWIHWRWALKLLSICLLAGSWVLPLSASLS